MWKVFLAFVFQRSLLFFVALYVVNQRLAPPEKRGILTAPQPLAVLWDAFVERAVPAKESASSGQTQLQAFASPSFFQSVLGGVSRFLGLKDEWAAIGLANLFLFLFLVELHAVLSRMALIDVATVGTILVLFLPASYELSLLPSFSFACFLVSLILHHALDNQWIIVGVGVALLGVTHPVLLLILPLLIYLFWYFQRHFFFTQVIKRLLFFLLPLVVVIVWRTSGWTEIVSAVKRSALFEWTSAIQMGSGFVWALSRPLLGQTAMAFLLCLGTVIAFLSNLAMAHKILPLYMFALLFAAFPFRDFASWAPLSGVCLEGIALVSTRSVARLLMVTLLAFGIYEVVTVFI